MVRTDSRDQKLQAFFKPANDNSSSIPTNETTPNKYSDQQALTNQNTVGPSHDKNSSKAADDTSIATTR